jgi:hypothetical protein
MRGAPGAPCPGSNGLPKKRRNMSSPSPKPVGETLALPSTRIVTTAGATTLTMSAYESRPPTTAWVMAGAAVVAGTGLVCA